MGTNRVKSTDVVHDLVVRFFVVLFGQYGSDEANQDGAVGEDAHDIGAPPDLPVESFLGNQICLGEMR